MGKHCRGNDTFRYVNFLAKIGENADSELRFGQRRSVKQSGRPPQCLGQFYLLFRPLHIVLIENEPELIITTHKV